eukprot:m51a1_g4750 hypothetical protein (1508) ;mRNA; r:400532-409181
MSFTARRPEPRRPALAHVGSRASGINLHVTGINISSPLLELASLETIKYGSKFSPPLSRKTSTLSSTKIRRAGSTMMEGEMMDHQHHTVPQKSSTPELSTTSGYFLKTQKTMRDILRRASVGDTPSVTVASTCASGSFSVLTTAGGGGSLGGGGGGGGGGSSAPNSARFSTATSRISALPRSGSCGSATTLPSAPRRRNAGSAGTVRQPTTTASRGSALAPLVLAPSPTAPLAPEPLSPSSMRAAEKAGAAAAAASAALAASQATRVAGAQMGEILECAKALAGQADDSVKSREASCTALARVLHAAKVRLYEVDKATSTMSELARDPETGAAVQLQHPTSRGIAGLAATTGGVYSVANAPSHAGFDPQIDGRGVGKVVSVLCAPVVSEGAIVGVVQAVNKRTGAGPSDDLSAVEFTHDDEVVLQLVLPFLVSGMRAACAVSRRQQLLEANRALSSELEIPALYNAVAGRAAELFRADCAQLFLVDGSSGELYLASGGASDMLLVQEKRSIVSHVATTGEPLIIRANAGQHPLFNANVDQPREMLLAPRTIAAWPVANSKSVMGVLELVNRRGVPSFGSSDDDEQLARAFIAQAGEAIQNASVFSRTVSSYKASVSTQHKYQALLEVAESLALHLESEDLTEMILQRARELVDAERSSLFLYDAQTNELCSQVAEGTAEGIRFPANHGIAGHVVMTGEVQNIKDAYSDPRFNVEIDKQTGFRTSTIICVPIKNHAGQVIGVTEIINKNKAGEFTKEDEELLKAFSIFCGLALHNASLYDRALHQEKKASALLDIVMALTSDNQITPMISSIMTRARELIDAERASLFVLDPKNKELRTQIADGAGEIVVPSKPSSIAGYVASTGQELAISDVYADPRFNPGIDRATGFKTHSVLAIPIMNESGEVVAVTEMINKRGGPGFKEEDRQLVKAFAAFCGNSLSGLTSTYNASKRQKKQFPVLSPTDADKAAILRWEFDVNGAADTEALIRCVSAMFEDMGLFDEFKIERSTFMSFLFELSKSYNTVPYHNFNHAVDVTQFIYVLLRSSPKVLGLLTKIEIFALLLSGLCHDVDHGGLNNAFQVNAQTPLALLFSNTSIMETYHCSRSIAILSNESFDILAGMTDEQRHQVWAYMIPIILSTDMANHFGVLAEFESAVKAGTLDCQTPQQKKLLCKVIIKCADISNVCRPFALAKKWAEILLREFFRQGEMERAKGLSVSPFMDREHVVTAQMQLGFINSIAYPMFDLLAKFLPDIRQHTTDVLAANAEQAPFQRGLSVRESLSSVHPPLKGIKYMIDRFEQEEQPREESVYYRMNRALRLRVSHANDNRAQRECEGPEAGDCWLGYAWLLTQAMRRLPVVQGEVFRGIDCAVGAGKYAAGAVVRWNGFTSTSRSRDVATDFLSGPGTLFVMQVARGRDMGCLNQFGEAEVLLESGTAFAVDSAATEGHVLVVRMHEVPSDSLLFPMAEGNSDGAGGCEAGPLQDGAGANPPTHGHGAAAAATAAAMLSSK